MLLSKRILFAINYNGPAHLLFLFFLYQKTEFTRIHSHSRALYRSYTGKKLSRRAYDRLHVIEIHDRGISGNDRRTDISSNTRLLAPIVPLYTTEIPSKMQEDTGRAGRNS